jgi:hypothetical protein
MKKSIMKNIEKFKKLSNESQCDRLDRNFSISNNWFKMVYDRLAFDKSGGVDCDHSELLPRLNSIIEKFKSDYNYDLNFNFLCKIIYKLDVDNSHSFMQDLYRIYRSDKSIHLACNDSIRYIFNHIALDYAKMVGLSDELYSPRMRYFAFSVNKYWTRDRWDSFCKSISLFGSEGTAMFKQSVFSINERSVMLAVSKFEDRWADALSICIRIVTDESIAKIAPRLKWKNDLSGGLHRDDMINRLLHLMTKTTVIKCDFKSICKALRVVDRLELTNQYNFENIDRSNNILNCRFVTRINSFKSNLSAREYVLYLISNGKYDLSLNKISEAIEYESQYVKKMRTWNRLPKDGWLRVWTSPENIEKLQSNRKMFSRFADFKNKIFGEKMSSTQHHSFLAFCNIFFAFYNDINLLTSLLKDKSMHEIHDMGQFRLPVLQSKDFDLFRRMSKDRDVVNSLKFLSILLANYSKIKELGFDMYETKMQDLIYVVNRFSYSYENVQDYDIAMEASALKLSQYDFEYLQTEITKLRNENKKSEMFPQVDISDEAYRLVKLEANDIKHLTIGAYVNCCQHIQGAGKSCAVDSYTNAQSAVYVLYKGSQIIAQSWVWFDDVSKGICFDNIESLGDIDNIFKYFSRLAHTLKEKMSKWLGEIKCVTIGTGYSDIDLSGLEYVDSDDKLYHQSYRGYTDSDSQKYIIGCN